jgi:hypothetical protein
LTSPLKARKLRGARVEPNYVPFSFPSIPVA